MIGQIAALLSYLRARFSNQPAWTGIEKTIADARSTQPVFLQTSPGPHNGPPMQRSETSHDDIEGQRSGPHRSTPIPIRRCFTCCATISSSTPPNSAAGSANAAPARCIVDGEAVLSCVTPLLLLEGKQVTTLEGLGTDRAAGADPARLHRRAGGAMRLLHRRHDDAGAGAAAEEPEADRCADPRRAAAESVPLRHAYAHPARGASRRGS